MVERTQLPRKYDRCLASKRSNLFGYFQALSLLACRVYQISYSSCAYSNQKHQIENGAIVIRQLILTKIEVFIYESKSTCGKKHEW